MICALLVFQTPDLPESLSELSPWLDWLITPRAYVYAQLSAQQHRRVIKTRTRWTGCAWTLGPPTSSSPGTVARPRPLSLRHTSKLAARSLGTAATCCSVADWHGKAE